MTKSFTRILSAASILTVFSTQAFAHHAMGGGLPSGPVEGFMSGLAHPVIGVDHLAFIIAVGILAAVSRAPVWAPLLFVGGTVLGALGALGGVSIAINEWLILGSVVLLGGALMLGFKSSAPAAFGAIGLAGLFHGLAYASSIIGAETTPITAYLIGFAVIQGLIVLGVMAVAQALWREEKLVLNARLAGALIAGIGLTFAVEGAEALLFAGIA